MAVSFLLVFHELLGVVVALLLKYKAVNHQADQVENQCDSKVDGEFDNGRFPCLEKPERVQTEKLVGDKYDKETGEPQEKAHTLKRERGKPEAEE